MGEDLWTRVTEAALGNPAVQAAQTDTFHVFLAIFLLATGLGALDLLHRRRLAGENGATLGPVAFANQLFSRFPLHVAGGAVTVLHYFQSLLIAINAFLGVLVLALPFSMNWIATQIAQQRGFLLTPRVRDGIDAFENQVLYVLLGYVVVGALLGVARAVFRGARFKEAPSPIALGAAGIASIAAVGLFVFLLFRQVVIFQTFFAPDGEANFGLQLAYNATIGTVGQNLYSQLLLAPVYAYAASAFIALIAFASGIVIFLIAPGRTNEASERRARLRRTFAGHLGPVAPGIVVSFLLTVASVSLIEYSGGVQDIYPTPAFLLLNAICDSITITVTLLIMRRIYQASRDLTAAGKSGVGASLLTRAMPWILLDLLISAVLAVTVLAVGAAEAGQAFSVRDAVYVLFGLAPDAPRLAFNASFWVMHTTFLPTLIILAAMFVALLMVPFLWLRALYTRIFGLGDRLLLAADVVAFLFGGSLAANFGLLWLLNVFEDFNADAYVAGVQILVGIAF